MAIVFMDTETTGLDVDGDGDEIWEFAAIRREADGTETEWHTFVEHDVRLAANLPEPFAADYAARFKLEEARDFQAFEAWSQPLFDGRPHIVGAVPDFDTAGLRYLLGVTRSASPWHYHLIDVEALAKGWIHGKDRALEELDELSEWQALDNSLPWDSKELSRAVGVDPDQFAEHTAMGDVRWAMAIYDVVMGGDR